MTDDLREERDFLIRSIRDLDDEHAAGDIADDDYRRLRDEYTARAADVLRRLDAALADEAAAAAGPAPSPAAPAVTATASAAGAVPASAATAGAAAPAAASVPSAATDPTATDPSPAPHDPVAPAPSPSAITADAAPVVVGAGAARSRRNARRRARIAAGVLLLAVVSGGAGYAVASSSGERLATEQVSGDITQGPTDRITQAQVLVSEGKVLEAVKVYDSLLADDPQNPVALAQRGWLLSQVDASLVDSGLESIERAIAIEPTYPDAYFFKGTILLRAKDEPQLASETYQRGIDAKPPPQLLSVLQQLKAEADARAAAGASTTSTP